jgi:hypothetical protein
MRLDELSDRDLLHLSEDFLSFCDAFGIPLFPWQREAFGGATVRRDGRFIYPLGGISVPRGDGKSLGGATVGAWRLRLGPQPQDILSVALDYDGARVVLDHAKRILRSHPDLEEGLEFRADSIVNPETGGGPWHLRRADCPDHGAAAVHVWRRDDQ